MFGKLLTTLTGQDDLERVAAREDLAALNAYLKTRRVFIPRRPRRFLEAGNFTPEQLQELLAEEAAALDGDPFEPWILEVDGQKRLPAFANQKRLEIFSKQISRELGQVFALGAGEMLLADLTAQIDVDFVDLNLFSEKSWEIGIRKTET
jgi:hypothetical protein